MSEELQNTERDLLLALTETEAEARIHRTQLETLEEEIAAIKQDLNGIREELLEEFLDTHLSPLLITWVIKSSDNGEITLDLAPAAGGELEYEKLRSGISWQDMDNLPLFYLLTYLGEGVPWTNTDLVRL